MNISNINQRIPYRIGYLMHGTRNVGGGEYMLYFLIMNLRKDLFNPIVFYVQENEIIRKLRETKIKLIQIPMKKEVISIYRSDVRKTPASLYTYMANLSHEILIFTKALRENKIDLIHPHDNLSKIIGGIAGKITGIKVVAHCHDILKKNLVDGLILLNQLIFIDRIIAVSGSVSNLFKIFGKIPKKVHTIYNSIDLNGFNIPNTKIKRKDLGIPENHAIIGVIGMFDPIKGHIYLLKALEKLIMEGCENITCLVVGEGRTGRELNEFVSKKNLEKQIQFLGYRNDIPDLLGVMDLLVIPSLMESFGIVALEAMAMKVPVIASRVGGLEEIIIHEKTGLLVPSGDVDALAGAIKGLLENPELRKSMGEDGRRRVEEKFGIEDSIRKIEALYLEVLSIKNPHGSLRLRRDLPGSVSKGNLPSDVVSKPVRDRPGEVINTLVSIVIPTYNRIHTFKKVIDSYLEQKYLHELIIIDDGSNDGTYEYLQEKAKNHPVIRIKKHEENLGVSASRNDGIDLATGDYILFGEDDLYFNSDYVSTLIDCMGKSNADIIAGRIVYSRVGETSQETINRCNQYNRPLINYWLMSGFYQKKIMNHQEMPFLHAISLVKVDVCRQIMFDVSFFAREETDFYLRACKEGFRIVLCPHTVCVHLPRDKGKGGGWRVGVLKYQKLASKNNKMLVDRHYTLLKEWGMKGNKITFKLLHILNRIRIMYLYFRFSTEH